MTTLLHRRSLALTAAMFGASMWAWPQIPADASIPVHWGLDLQPDRYGGKVEGLLLLPAISLVVSLVLGYGARAIARRSSRRPSTRAYDTIRTTTVGLLAFIHGAVVLHALGRPLSMAVVLPLGLGLALTVMGNVMGRLRPNPFVGARTPWTLTSDLSWNETNRLTGRLFVLIGLGLLAVGVGGGSPHLAAGLVAALVAVVVIVMVYSWVIWRRDPDRRGG